MSTIEPIPVGREYLNFTSELLQDLFNVYTEDNRHYVYAFSRDSEQAQPSVQHPSERSVNYTVSLSKPTKSEPIPSVVFHLSVHFMLPSAKALKNLYNTNFMQHIVFKVEHLKEHYHVKVSAEGGSMNWSTLKDQFSLMVLLDQFLGK